jgi:uncharacterized Zn-finger protein
MIPAMSKASTAQNLPAPETVEVATTRPFCNGGGALGHPRIFLTIGADGFIDCPYCDRRYTLKAGRNHHH